MHHHVTATRRILAQRHVSTRLAQASRRYYAVEPAPHPPSSPPNPNSNPKEPSRVGAYYTTFGSPILKCFLGALFTYQLAYYAWLKLETIEETHEQKTAIRDLQEELRDAIAKQKGKLDVAVGELEEVRDIVVEGVKEGREEVGRTTEAVGRVAKGGWWPW